MMGRERAAAAQAMDSGVYGVWRCMGGAAKGEDCGRVGAASRCFCGSAFSEHSTKPPHE